MFIIGLCIHLLFLFSIFDIYFKSPIVNNVTSYQPQHEAVADRLVLFIIDGLRAESFVNYTTMPYLRSVGNSHGRWGISSTRVPTESRPGHVAVIAGFYEDPSAVAKGWKENPVDFDSIFNQSLYTWCWGTYDIIEIFTKGNNGHIFNNKFDPYDQTFSTDKNTTHLDTWVFENVKNFFNEAKHDPVLNEKLKYKKIVFFLHLLGTDTAGHTHKPKTKPFLTTIQHVDGGIKQIEEVITQFYNNDGRTTFLMTSDHGMTDWGSHGAGDDHETQTPYVLWGTGVKQGKGKSHIDPYTNEMSLENRFDIQQADLAPLMSTILSIPVPVNSIGQLPAELLNMSLSNKAKAIYSNTRQLLSQYNKKRLDVEAYAISMLYKPYELLNGKKYTEIIEITEKLLTEENYDKLIILCEEIMQLSLSGLDYYHNYYQRPLLVFVTLAFTGWIICLLKMLIQQKISTTMETSNMKKSSSNSTIYLKKFLNVSFTILLTLASYIVFAQNLPIQYYLYFTMPIFIWWYVLNALDIWIYIYNQFKSNRILNRVWIEILCYSLGSVAMALSFTYRWMLSIPLVGMGLWPFFTSTKSYLPKYVLIGWPFGCILLSIFSFMPVVGKQAFIELVILSGLIWIMTVITCMWKILIPHNQNNEDNRKNIILSLVQVILLLVSLQNIYAQSKRFENGTSVSYIYQTMAWIIAVTSLVLPLGSSKKLICRLLAINTSLLNFYHLLSVSHEGLFLVTLIYNLFCWMYIEFRLSHLDNTKLLNASFDKGNTGEDYDVILSERSVSSQDFRRAFFSLLYIMLAFFGTGNIASLNSFEVRWVTCFMTSFQPLVITTLILLKSLAPFLCVGCTFRAVQLMTKAPSGYSNIIVLIYSNIMGIQLLYYVKNTGSWLEIGTSISQFVIVQIITLFIVLINQMSKILTDINMYYLVKNVFKPKKKYA